MAHEHGPPGAAGLQLRHRRRDRLDPHRRGPHAAHHLGPGGRRGQALLQVRQHRPRASSATPTTTSTRRSAGRPHDEGIEAVEKALGVENMYDEVVVQPRPPLQSALKAKELFKRDKDYVVQHGEVKIVDEFTGRILEGRRWTEGLHQAVEAKEGVRIKEENQTLATVTLQNYFRMYDKLSGMTGTAADRGRPSCSPPTSSRSCRSRRTGRMIRVDHADVIYKTEEAEVHRRRRGHRRVLRDRPARARRHHLGREVREALAPAREAGHPPRGAQRQAAPP